MQKIFIVLIILLLYAGCAENSASSEDTLCDKNSAISYQILFMPDSTEPAGTCYRIPALIKAPNGDLIAVADQRIASCGDLKQNRNINIVMRRSTDNGITWTKMQTLVDYPLGQSASDASLICDEETKEIFLFFNYMNLDKEKNVFYLRYIKSSDNGISWSKAKDITAEITKPAWKNDFKFISSGRGIQCKDGTLLHTLVNLQRGLHVFGSNNHGKTWFLKEAALNPADESKIIELKNGTWMVNSRVPGAGCRYVYRSCDKGKTWLSQKDTTLIDPACNASIIKYNFHDKGNIKNLILFSNVCAESERKNLSLKISEDQGKTWAHQKIIYPGSAAYSSMAIDKNGFVGILFEKDNYSEIAFTRLNIKKLIEK